MLHYSLPATPSTNDKEGTQQHSTLLYFIIKITLTLEIPSTSCRLISSVTVLITEDRNKPGESEQDQSAEYTVATEVAFGRLT